MARERYDDMTLIFNQDHSCFTCSTNNGVRLFNTDPLTEIAFLPHTDVGSISICEMLYRTNLCAIVGGGNRPKFAENAILIWDHSCKKFILEFTFNSTVLSVRLKSDILVCALTDKIHVFSFPYKPKKLFTVQTSVNPRGLLQMTPSLDSETQLLVYPGHKTGSVQLLNLASRKPGMSSTDAVINAHVSELACIAINHTGTLIATASKKGTLIRVFDTIKRSLVIELRRGSDSARVYCINFSIDSNFLCCSSDKGTVHIFAVKDEQLNRRSKLQTVRIIGQFVDSQWALTNFTVNAECGCMCAFGQNSTVTAICLDGSYHRYSFRSTGGCNRINFALFRDSSCDIDI